MTSVTAVNASPVSGIDGPAVAMIGGGQLARMTAQAAIGLGVPLRVLVEETYGSAAQVVRDPLVGDHRRLDDLRRAVEGCAVVTFDHEHVPTEHLRALEAEGHVCRPGSRALVYAQDKAAMRVRLGQLWPPSPRHAVVSDAREVDDFVAAGRGRAVVLKTIRGGYDGKGVWTVASGADAEPVLADAQRAGQSLLVEEWVDIARELSALVVRSPSGQVAAYPVVQSVQRNGICIEVIAPAPGLDAGLAVEAQQLAMRIAGELDVVGVLAVELFETPNGRLLVNELAMRPHNTGHWSIDGAVTSQFENHLRAVLDLPLGDPRARERWTVTVNVLGGSVGSLYNGYPHVLARDPALRMHMYGKGVRPGRKVGHVTAYGDDLDDVLRRTRHAAGWFAGEVEE
ncbi:MAG: 5-(carboxyamino)imidazole ribonucleotide synthase [Nocardioidaceae bacterium]